MAWKWHDINFDDDNNNAGPADKSPGHCKLIIIVSRRIDLLSDTKIHNDMELFYVVSIF